MRDFGYELNMGAKSADIWFSTYFDCDTNNLTSLTEEFKVLLHRCKMFRIVYIVQNCTKAAFI